MTENNRIITSGDLDTQLFYIGLKNMTQHTLSCPSGYIFMLLGLVASVVVLSQAQIPVSYMNPCFYADSASASGASAIGTITAPFAGYYSINNTNYNIFRGLVNFQYTSTNNALSYHLAIGTKGFTSISFEVSSSYPAAVIRYTIRYMVIDIANFPSQVFFTDVNFTNFVLNTGNLTFDRTVNPPGGNLFGPGNTPYTYCVLVHMQFTDLTASNNFGINTECTATNPALFNVKFHRVRDASYSVVGINIMIFDKTFVEATLSVTLEYQYFPFNKSGGSNYVEDSGFVLMMEEHSSFMGLSGFKYLGVSSVRFDTVMNYTNQSVSVYNSSNSVDFFDYFNYFNINDNTLGCPFTYPYQLGVTSNGTCYSTIPLGYFLNSTSGLLQASFCPDGQYINSADNQCYPCMVTCLTCLTGTNCSSCNTSNFREFNNATDQCDPITGYYESGVAEAFPCEIGCILCTNGSFCLECDNSTNRVLSNGSCVAAEGFYTINGTVTAQPCSSLCLTCVNTADFCLSCNASLNRELNSSNASCDPMPGYYQSGTDAASACSIACISCTNGSVCLECDNATYRALVNDTCQAIDGFYTTNGTVNALPCDSSCLTCSGSASTCTSCHLNSTLINSTCILCSGLFPNCTSCTSSLCLSCDLTLVFNALNACTNCDSSCLTCDSLDTNCTSCADGGYLSASNSCLACSYPCLNCNDTVYCLTCANGSNQWFGSCIFCQNGQYFSNGSCLLCNASMPGCSSCFNDSVCSPCENGFFLDTNTSQCVACSSAMTNCVSCSSETACSACISSDYEFSTVYLQCVSIQCGDGIVQSTQECDDGNATSKDGCFNCYVEADWMCNNSVVSQPSICSYIGKLKLTLVTLIKQEGQNAIQIVFKIQSGQNAEELLKKMNFSDILTIDGANIDTQYTYVYNPDDGTLTVEINYTDDIQSQELNINFDPGSSNDTALIKQDLSSLKISVFPQNNQLAIYYEKSDYDLTNITKYATMATAALFILLFLIAMATGKVIGVQAIAVAQFAFISIMVIEDQSPTFAALKEGLIVCIYSPVLGPGSPDINVESADHIRGMYLYNKMVYNFSIDMIIIMIPIFIGLVLLLLAKTALKDKKEHMKPWQQKFFYEYTFHLLLFSGYFGFTSLVIQFLYGNNLQESVGALSYVMAATFILMVIIYTTLFIKLKPNFGQYHSFFDHERGIIYVMMVGERAIMGSLVPICAHMGVQYSQCVFIGVFLLIGIIILVRKPYLEKHQGYRQIANYSIAIAIQGIYLVPTFVNDDSSPILIYAPLAVIGLLFICFIFNGILLIKEICKETAKQQEKKIENHNEEDNYLSDTRKKNDTLQAILPFFREKTDSRALLLNITNLQDLAEVSTPEALNTLENYVDGDGNANNKNALDQLSEELENELSYKLAKKRVKEERIRRNSESPEMLHFSNFNNAALFQDGI